MAVEVFSMRENASTESVALLLWVMVTDFTCLSASQLMLCSKRQ